MRISGADDVLPLHQMVATNWPLIATGETSGATGGRGRASAAIYAEFSPAENQGQSRGELVAAERTLVETGGGVFSHTVGVAVHDVGGYRNAPLEPGRVFSVDPQLWVREENFYLRFEDTVVVTEDGAENFTDFIPMELDEMETMVLEKGVVQKVPPVPEHEITRVKSTGNRR